MNYTDMKWSLCLHGRRQELSLNMSSKPEAPVCGSWIVFERSIG